MIENTINESPKQCSSSTVKTYLYRNFSNKKSRSQARSISALKSFFNYLLFEGEINSSPLNDIESPKIENKLPEVLTEDEMKRCDLVILNYPNNPTSADISMDDLASWVKKALEFGFILVNDECYSEIYFDENDKPVSILEASIKAGNDSFKNVIAMNSISKRSSAPGLRSGIIAGDAKILKEYMKYRTYVGCAAPVPLQEAATVAWNDQAHVDQFRAIYKQNFDLAKEILGVEPPKSTFYIWLEVGDEIEFTRELYRQKNIKVLPGSFLGRNGIGKGYVRIALVENATKTKEVLIRLKEFMNEQR